MTQFHFFSNSKAAWSCVNVGLCLLVISLSCSLQKSLRHGLAHKGLFKELNLTSTKVEMQRSKDTISGSFDRTK